MFRILIPQIVLVITALSVLAISAHAEVPKQISYQGRLTDDTGAPVPDGDYNLTFQIVEHDPLPMGESPLWSSGMQTVTTTDGLFVYYLGSNVPLPTSVFTDDGLESHYLRFALEGAPLFSTGIRLATVPFAFKAGLADTAAYAHSGPTGGASGWVDDGSVVRLSHSTDYVGIGTDSPNYRLDVRGTIGNTATLYHSDRRWKKNITSLTNSLDKVQRLRGVSYDWKRSEFAEMNFPEGKQIGLIAQEVEIVLPEVVRTGTDGYRSVDYCKLVALLIEANKEQQRQIESHKEQITSQQEQLIELKELVNQLIVDGSEVRLGQK